MATKDEEALKAQFSEIYMHILKYMGDFVSIPTQKYQLTFEAFQVMEKIAKGKGGVTLVDIAKDQGVSKSAIARQINGLLEKKYVTQKIDPDDRRVKYITLTASGNRVHRKLSEETSERFHQWLEVFGTDEAAHIMDAIEEANEKAISQGFTGFESLHDKRRNSTQTSVIRTGRVF